MAQPYVTGPVHLFAKPPGQATPLYLGTGKQAPFIEIKPEYEPLFNDIGGSKHPFDMAFEGEIGLVGVRLTRWKETTHALLAARPLHVLPRGTNSPGEIGSLMLLEQLAYPLWLSFPYTSKAAYPDLPDGYKFFRTFLLGPDRHEPQGTVPKELNLVWIALREYGPATQKFDLYNHDMTEIAAVTID